MLELGGITEAAYRSQQVALEGQRAAYEIACKELESQSLGFRDEDLLEQGIEPAQDQMLRRQQLIDLNTRTLTAELVSAQASLDSAKKNLKSIQELMSHLVILSPKSGVVAAKYFEQGEFLAENEKLLTIISTAITSTTDATASAGAIDLTEGTITVTETNATLLITIQASKQIKFGGPIYAAINDSPIAAPYLIVKGSQTLDFDGDGEITIDDANYLYNYIVTFGCDEYTMATDIMAFGTKYATEEKAELALAYFKNNLQSLDYDGDGEITIDDANYVYNFIVTFGCDEYTMATDIMAFGTKSATEEKAQTALTLFFQLIQ